MTDVESKEGGDQSEQCCPKGVSAQRVGQPVRSQIEPRDSDSEPHETGGAMCAVDFQRINRNLMDVELETSLEVSVRSFHQISITCPSACAQRSSTSTIQGTDHAIYLRWSNRE